MPGSDPLKRNLQLAGILLILGLLVEALCLAWKGPLAFLVFAGLGGLLFLAGIVVYLLSLVSVRHNQE
jgi:hypothetical protein